MDRTRDLGISSYLTETDFMNTFILEVRIFLDSHLSWTLCYYIIIWYPAAFLGWSLIVTLIIIWGPSCFVSERSDLVIALGMSSLRCGWRWSSSTALQERRSRRSGRLVQCAFRLFGVIITKINVNWTDPNFVITITSRISRRQTRKDHHN